MASPVSSTPKGDDLGLDLIYKPKGVLPYLDIVLVHGIGRTSKETWAVDGHWAFFWPEWLSNKGSLRMARVWAINSQALLLRSSDELTSETINIVTRCLWDKLAESVSGIRLHLT
jgi:hypothetical protein